MAGNQGHGCQMGRMSRVGCDVLERVGSGSEYEVVGLGGVDIDAHLNAFELGDNGGELHESVAEFGGHGLTFGRCAGETEDYDVFYHN